MISTISSRSRGQPQQQEQAERPGSGSGHADEPTGDRSALNLHSSLRQEFEDGESEEDSPDYAPGDCVVA